MKPLSENSISALTGWLGEQDEFVFLDCARVKGKEKRSYLFIQPKQWLACNAPEESAEFLKEADALRAQGKYLAGWIAYEFGYLLEPSLVSLCPPLDSYALLGVFENPLVIDHESDNLEMLDELLDNRGEKAPEEEFRIDGLQTNIDKDEYLDAIARIKEYIVDGDTYQVNFTMKLMFNFGGSPAALYRSLRRNQGVSYGGWIRRGRKDIMSFSPELFFRASKDRITVRPMKGTMKRGQSLAEDKHQREILHTDIKNRSENVMIVDLLRNDLGRLLHATGGGKVQPRSLFDVEVYDTVLQMTSTIDGLPLGNASPGLQEILPALFPCGSVTGAPKIRTMEIIHELEKEPRNVYCGAIGFSGPQESVFNVPIRTVILNDGIGEMGIGSGIVFDSDPEGEWLESLLKAKFLTGPQPDFQLIETLLWRPGSGYWLLDNHMERLADSAAYFLFLLDREKVVKVLTEQEKNFLATMRVRLLLYRDGRVEVTVTELPQGIDPVVEPTQSSDPLPRVVFSDKPTDPANIHLYHKTTLRKLYEDEREQKLAEGYFEVLFYNARGEVTEGSISNIFLLRDGRLLTPPVKSGLLAGTFRKYLLDTEVASEEILTREDVEGAEAVYIGNSVRGLMQVEVAKC